MEDEPSFSISKRWWRKEWRRRTKRYRKEIGLAFLVNSRFRQKVRREYSWREVLLKLDLLKNARGREGGSYYIHCRWHQEKKSASLQLWPDGGGCCYGCYITLDMVDLVVRIVNPSGDAGLRRWFAELRNEVR